MLTQQELIEKLGEMGAAVTSQTLRTREKQGLVTPAYRGKSGRPGRSVFYPDKCLYEHYAAGKMLSSSRLRLTAEQVKDARDEFMAFIAAPMEGLLYRPEEEMLDFRLGEHWFAWYTYAFAKCGKGAFAAQINFYVVSDEDRELVHAMYVSTDRDIALIPKDDWHDIFEVNVYNDEFLQTGNIQKEEYGLMTMSGAPDFPATGIVFLDAGSGTEF